MSRAARNWQTTPEGRADRATGGPWTRKRENAIRWHWLMYNLPIKQSEKGPHFRRALRRLVRLRHVYPTLVPAIWKPIWEPKPCAACSNARRRHGPWVPADIAPYWPNPMRTELVVWLCDRCFTAWKGP